jgi:hypothetical protein
MPDEQYPQVMRAFRGHDWAIMPEKLDAILAVLEIRAAGGRVPDDKIDAATVNRPNSLAQASGDVAVVEVFGMIMPRANTFSRFSGGTSCEELGRTFDELMASDKIGAIVLDIDSPGGAVAGVPELADGIDVVVLAVGLFAVGEALYVAAYQSRQTETLEAMRGSLRTDAALREALARAHDRGVARREGLHG